MTNQIILAELEARSRLVAEVSRHLTQDIQRLADLFASIFRNGGKLFFAGNGGSAADAQHLAAEYVVRYSHNRNALPAIALSTDSSVITATANDFSFDRVFARQVEALCGPHDLLVLHSTSGASPNLLHAAAAARSRRTKVVALLAADGGELKEVADHVIIVPSHTASHAQEMQMAIEHIICMLVEQQLCMT